ncbi:hypothetical protein FOZ62_011390 [Perkinsus olseni]|uniref:Uncharacterized protein n=1 Tax=Perkinsus olseni TaxID=32597 RepID=A0A7J6NYI3_PEROL|nr:hypothetical protein FOZ62_011390 [Perkinsus olseni]
MPLMKLSTYLLGCLTISQLTNGVVLQQETGSSDFLGTQHALDQGNNPVYETEATPIDYPPDQLYGPLFFNGSCPTIDNVRQFPAHYHADPTISVCMPFPCPCPESPAKGGAKCGDPGVCRISCQTEEDCQQGAICINTGVAKLCAFNTTSSYNITQSRVLTEDSKKH